MRAENYSQAFAFARRQVRALARDHPDRLPVYTVGGRWDHEGDVWTNWCEGFPAGMMWIFFERTGEPEWRGLAERYSRLLKGREFDREVHDQGFLFWSSWKRWHDIDGGGGDQRRPRASRADAGAAIQRKGPVSAFVPGGGINGDRHHDERERHIPRRERKGG